MTEKRLKIAFLSRYAPTDRKASSGTNYKMAEELSKIGDLEWIPIRESAIGRYGGKFARGWNRLFKKRIYFFGSFFGARYGYKPIQKEIFKDYDVVVAFFCMPVLANINTDKPVVYFSDATAPAMVNYYPQFTNLIHTNLTQVEALEKRAMDNATAIVLSSNWAADSAINALSQSKDKVHIVEFGANIDDKDIDESDRTFKNQLDILFLGVDWERKGGKIAADAVKWLNENNIAATLHIVGIRELPDQYKNLPFIKNYGFLNKNIPEDYRRLNNIISKMHCMLLPTIAECAGIAFAESSANGLPVFTHDTGGVPNYVHNGDNGYMLPLGSCGRDFGMKIKEVVESGELSKLSEGGRKIYKEKLSWSVWGNRVSAIIQSLIRN